VDPDLDSEELAGISAGADPHTYKQAMNSPDVLYWKKAMLEKINALLQNGTLEIVRLPEGDLLQRASHNVLDLISLKSLHPLFTWPPFI
jgi:hypothetical protein